jgi:1-deoxy-D-xylulose-5-phosphate reductoisomerase
MNQRNLAILGSTGSIGQSALRVLRNHPGRFKVVALGAHGSVEAIEVQYREFRPEYLCLVDETAASELRTRLKDEPVEVLTGAEDLICLAGLDSVDLVLNAIVGAAGLRASLKAVEEGKLLALANKESLVAGGPLLAEVCRAKETRILPVDSEHSAIWQALRAGRRSELRKIILTASGGPFRTWSAERMATVTPKEALNHPTWKMGPKITIDSATLANKGLEVMEAVVLFGVEPNRVQVVIHPQSIVHSAVEFVDSSVIAQLSEPDMCLPIVHALFWPERLNSDFGVMDWGKLRQLTFEPPDFERFGALKLAFEAAEAGGTAPAVYNAANEVAVAAFLDGAVKFTEIVDIIAGTLDRTKSVSRPKLEDILDADRWARETARQIKELMEC